MGMIVFNICMFIYEVILVVQSAKKKNYFMSYAWAMFAIFFLTMTFVHYEKYKNKLDSKQKAEISVEQNNWLEK